MIARRARRFPPARLAPVPERHMPWVRRVWFAVLALAVVIDIAGAVFIMRDAYRFIPAFGRVTLSHEVENDGSVTVETIPGLPGVTPIPPPSRIISIGSEPVARDTPLWELSARLEAKEGETVALGIALPNGRTVSREVTVSQSYAEDAVGTPINRNARMALRMTVSLLTCLTLIACAVLLFVRRPADPVALLFSFSFLLFASIIDPPLLLWMATGMGTAFDVVGSLGWLFLVVGLAVFPDGRFNPRPTRWILIVAPIAAFGLSVDNLPMEIGTITAFVAPLFLLGSHVIKYRRFPPGIERQQIKWAAFGFGTGLVLLAITFAFVAIVPTSTPLMPIYSVIILVLFSLGFLAMALGLLVALLRFRLWEADRVISRSAIAAAVTLAVGIVWTLSVDFVKIGVEWVLGEESETVATVAGAVLAAGIFAPTQALAMRWAKRRLAGDETRIQRLIDRLAVWRTTESPEEIGVRTLSALSAAVHCNCAALMVDGPRGLRLLAARDVEQADELDRPAHDPAKDTRFAMILPLEDEDGPIGQLLVGPRSDLNRYNAAQLDGLKDLTEPLAEALRTSLKRFQLVEGLHSKLGTVEERLARLEQGGPRLSPT